MDDNKIAAVGDLHLGVYKNNEKWLKQALDYADWLVLRLEENNLNTVIFLGDIFDDRHQIGQNTLHTCAEFFGKFKNFSVKIIVGNHDSFLKDISNITPLTLFNGWKNIEVINNLKIEIINNKKVCYCSWGNNFTELSGDLIFGHFEITSFKRTIYNICDKGLSPKDLLDRFDFIFSGHFHIKSLRKYGEKEIIYTGNAFPKDFNDVGDQKGFYIIDFNDKISYKFIENDMSPTFVQVNFSNIKEKTFNEEVFKNNFIKIIMDKQITSDEQEKLVNRISSFQPNELSVDYKIEKIDQNDENFVSVEVNLENIITEYIKQIQFDGDKEKLLQETLNLYEISKNKLKMDEKK